MSENIYIEPSNLDYIIIKTKDEMIAERGSLYEATRKAWYAKLETAKPYKYVLSVTQGVVREVYEVEKWQMSGDSDRIEFIGHVAPEYIKEWFMGKMIPEKYRVKGLASPFLYKKLVDGEETGRIDIPVAAKPTPTPVSAPKPAPKPEPAAPKKKSKKWLWILLLIIAGIILAILSL